MKIALEQARLAAQAGETPVGAAILRGGEVIALAHNRTERDHDATAHAEMLALRAASRALATRYLNDCTLYVTLEPCPMCAQAIAFARIGRLVFGAYDPKGGGVEHGPRIFRQPSCHHVPDIIGGVMESECGALLKEFFQQKRRAML